MFFYMQSRMELLKKLNTKTCTKKPKNILTQTLKIKPAVVTLYDVWYEKGFNQSRFFYSGLSNLNHCEVH